MPRKHTTHADCVRREAAGLELNGDQVGTGAALNNHGGIPKATRVALQQKPRTMAEPPPITVADFWLKL